MNWPKILTKERVEPLTLEERGALLTGIIAIAEGLPIKKSSNQYLEMLLDSVRTEAKMSKRNSTNGKKGGNPALKAARSEPEAKLAHTEPAKQTRKTSNKLSSKDVESEIVAFTQNEKLRETIRAFVDYRKESGHALTVHAFKLMLGKLEGMSSSDEERIDILNNSIVGGYQGIFKPNRNSGKAYGPNGVAIKPEAERLHDLDEIFGIGV